MLSEVIAPFCKRLSSIYSRFPENSLKVQMRANISDTNDSKNYYLKNQPIKVL